MRCEYGSQTRHPSPSHNNMGVPTELLSSRMMNIGTQISPHTLTQTNMSAEHHTARESHHNMQEVVSGEEERRCTKGQMRRKFNMRTDHFRASSRNSYDSYDRAQGKGTARRVISYLLSRGVKLYHSDEDPQDVYQHDASIRCKLKQDPGEFPDAVS
ncbi:hypothetical protein BKA93DRAFT_877501 [Sparassis latifolia]